MQGNKFFTEANRFICQERLNSPDIAKRPGLKSLLESRLCNIGIDNTDKHSLTNQPEGVIYMSTTKKPNQKKQTIESLNRTPIENLSEKDLLRELLSEIRALREVAQFGITKAEHEGKTGSYAAFDC